MAGGIDRKFYGYYGTKDAGFIDGDELYVLGRKDDMILSYGKNIFPYELERYISKFPGVVTGRVSCFGHFREDKGTHDLVVCAEVENVNDVKLKQCIISQVKEMFDLSVVVDLVPKLFVVKTSSGKISRRRTLEKWLRKKQLCDS